MQNKISDYIKLCAKKNGRTLKGVAEYLNMNYKTLFGKIQRGNLTVHELFRISEILDLDLNQMKIDLDYNDLYPDNVVFMADRSDICKDEDSDIMYFTAMKQYTNSNIYNNSKNDLIPAFIPQLDESGNTVYSINYINNSCLKDTGRRGRMIRIPNSDKFTFGKYIINVSNVPTLQDFLQSMHKSKQDKEIEQVSK